MELTIWNKSKYRLEKAYELYATNMAIYNYISAYNSLSFSANATLHWNAILSGNFGSKYSWNLGIGYGRASDAASGEARLYKAKQNDMVFVCYGVNDILHGENEEEIKTNLKYIVDVLKKDGKKFIMQTIPPFDYKGEKSYRKTYYA